MERELRVITTTDVGVEARTITRDDGTTSEVYDIVGKAVVFNELSQNLGWFRELISPTAFEGCDMSDVVCLKNHDNNIPLGRSGSGLTLEIKPDGMYFRTTPPNTTAAKDAIEEIRSGNIKGCSFQFSIAPGGQTWDQDPVTGGEIRTVTKIHKLYDVGPVTMPAYLQTTTDVAKRSYEAYKKEQAPAPEPEPEIHYRRLSIERRLKARTK